MVALQNKFKPVVAQNVSEPDGMIDIDLQTDINKVIEINKKKLFNRRSYVKKLLYLIPICILVTTFALLLLRNYLSNILNKPLVTESEIIPVLEYTQIKCCEDGYDFPNLEFSKEREHINDEKQPKVKRDVKLHTPHENVKHDKIPNLANSNEIITTSTPGYLYVLSFYKGNKLKTVPLPNQNAKDVAKSITRPSFQKGDTSEWKKPNFGSESTESVPNIDESDSTSTFSTENLSSKINQPSTESSFTSLDENSPNEFISSTENYDFDQLTTDGVEEVTFFKRPDEDTGSLTETVSPILSTTHSNQLKEYNFNSESTESESDFDESASTSNLSTDELFTKVDQSSTELNSITAEHDINQLKTDELEEVTFRSNNDTTTQFSASESDKIVVHLNNLKIETSSASTSYTPEENESKIDFSTEIISTNSVETSEYFLTTDSENDTTPQTFTPSSNEAELDSSTFPHNLRLNNQLETRLLNESFAVESTVDETKTSKSNLTSSKISTPQTDSTTDISEEKSKYNLTVHSKDETPAQFTTPTSEQVDMYESTYQENFNNKIKITTKSSDKIEKNKTMIGVYSEEKNTANKLTELYTKATLSSFNPNARFNSINSDTTEWESIITTKKTFDANYQSTDTNEESLDFQTNIINQTPKLLDENFQDENGTSSSNLFEAKLNDTNRYIQDMLKNFSRRATARNQQNFNNKNNKFPVKQNSNNWQEEQFSNFEDDKDKGNEPPSSNVQIPSKQQTNQQIPLITNQNNPLTVCPNGVKILQQPNTFPYYYNFPSLYQNILPLPAASNNPYVMSPQYSFPYGSNNLPPYGGNNLPPYGGNNLPPYGGNLYPYGSNNLQPFYNNPPLQLGGYYPNNLYGDNSPQNGQYYVCTSLSSNPYIKTVPEIRKENNFMLQKTNNLEDSKNGTRMVGECPFGEYRCNDGSKCIKRNQYCDNAVHCNDMSDELECSCISRIDRSRMCDGYLDCPDGEDESKCFGCDEDSFNCDDWTPQDKFSTCIPLDQRCNGVVNCPNAKDEEKCSVLTEYFSTEQNFLITYAKGFLYRNVRGKWYPVCRNPEIWANEACRIDGGGNYMSPLTHLIQTNINYGGPYLSMSPKGQITFDNTCDKNLAVYVECALLVCGTRLTTRNYYRREEVDTSAEQIVGQSLNSDENARNVTDPLLGNSRVVGGKPSQPESWPWVVSIYRNGVFHCGGVLINEFWIVTAAHCVDKYWHYYFEVQAGMLRRYSYSPIVQSRIASHIIAHQSYDKMKLKNDIALINLNNPVRYNRYVRPICLPSEITAGQNFMRNPQPNTICSAIGWGATAEHGSDPDHLREVDVPVLKNCKYKEDREGHEICAGLREGGKDACQGDSGGPFLCQNPNVANQWYLAGIVSHGEGCARPNEPGVYTRVSMYLDWIYENMRSHIQQRMQPLSHCPGYTCKDTKRCIPKQRHCDRIIDCLYADDEIGCDRSHFSEIFKHAILNSLVSRSGQDENSNNQDIEVEENQSQHDNNEPDNVLGQTQNSDISSELFETIATNNSFIENSVKSNPQSHFSCQKMIQTIAITKRCDKIHDCEDATDEENCTCVDYLKYSHPDAVCDDVVDCFDGSDEQNCAPKCRSNEFYCYLSNVCIQSYKQCDGKQNCPAGEDEQNCFALTDLNEIKLGIDSRPILMKDGFVSFYHNGTWQIVCGDWNTTQEAQHATQICLYLGFHDYNKYYKFTIPNKPLTVIQNGKSFTPTETGVSNKRCVAMKVGCSDTIDITHEVDVITKQSFDNFEFIPWNTEIYVNGQYKCSGALLEPQWVVTTKTCFGNDLKLHINYVAVLLGGRSKMYLNVRNAYEQVIRVVEYIFVGVSDIALLRLEKMVIVSSYIRPLGLSVKQYNSNEKQVCVVVGRNASNQTELLYLKSLPSCTATGFRCFTKDLEIDNSSCENKTYSFWGGSVVCRSGRGWYPASVFYSHFGHCLTTTEMWSSIQYWKPDILKLMKQTPFYIDPPLCKGFRCYLGECIENRQVCDGIPHCRDGEDEEANYCANEIENCTATQSCECKPSDLKCKNGKCVEKFRFCDQINDCGDFSDEPTECDCRSYLEVTNPEKLCDGVRNCQDRTDEDPYICKCTENKFRCEQSNLCVSEDVICDRTSDCPNGEDESFCIGLTTGSSEVKIRTAGLWHPGCFAEHLTTLQLEDICGHIGYTGGSAIRHETVKFTSGRPVIDPFIGIIVNRINNQSLIIAKREGDKPYVTYTEDHNCYRLFLECL